MIMVLFVIAIAAIAGSIGVSAARTSPVLADNGTTMFEVWGNQSGTGRPEWFQVIVSLAKLFFIGWILIVLVFTVRDRPKDDYYENM